MLHDKSRQQVTATGNRLFSLSLQRLFAHTQQIIQVITEHLKYAFADSSQTPKACSESMTNQCFAGYVHSCGHKSRWRLLKIATWCIVMTEAVTLPNLIAFALLVSEIWLAKDTHTHRHTQTHRHTHTRTHTHNLAPFYCFQIHKDGVMGSLNW